MKISETMDWREGKTKSGEAVDGRSIRLERLDERLKGGWSMDVGKGTSLEIHVYGNIEPKSARKRASSSSTQCLHVGIYKPSR